MTDRVLVTGGAGFIGAHVVRGLLDCGYAVDVIDDLSGGFMENVDPRATFYECSTCDQQVHELFSARNYRYVYHLAAYAAEGLSHFIRNFNYTNNIVGSTNIINACVNSGVECLVFTSSIAVYGAGQLPMTEDQVPQPEDPYGIAKFAVEMDLHCAHEMFGMNYVVFRPHNVYGEYQNIADKYRNVIGIFMSQVLNDQPMTIFGDGCQTRAFSYIGDLLPSFLDAPTNRQAFNRVFNIGADQPYSVGELAAAVGRAMGHPDHPVVHLPARNEVVHAFSDHTRAREVFGEVRYTDLESGIAIMADWVKAVGRREAVSFGGIEIEKNLPPSWRQHD